MSASAKKAVRQIRPAEHHELVDALSGLAEKIGRDLMASFERVQRRQEEVAADVEDTKKSIARGARGTGEPFRL